MAEIKYVIVKDEFGLESPVLFPKFRNHNHLAHKPISAGFCEIYPREDHLEVEVWGESTTCKVSSRTEDKQIIEHMLNTLC